MLVKRPIQADSWKDVMLSAQGTAALALFHSVLIVTALVSVFIWVFELSITSRIDLWITSLTKWVTCLPFRNLFQFLSKILPQFLFASLFTWTVFTFYNLCKLKFYWILFDSNNIDLFEHLMFYKNSPTRLRFNSQSSVNLTQDVFLCAKFKLFTQ